MIKILAGTMVAAAAMLTAPASAAIDAYNFFNGVNGNAGFYYGTVSGTIFTDFDRSSVGGCFLPGGTCLYSSTSSDGVIPGVVKGGSYPTVNYSGATLALHPSNGLAVFAGYQAPAANVYRMTVTLKSIGTDTTNGIGYSVFQNGVLGPRQVLPTYGSSTLLLRGFGATAGDRFGVVIDSNGFYGGDTTSLVLRISAAPEPAQWALMIGGFGLVGAASRRRRTLAGA